MKYDIGQISKMLADRALSVCEYLLPSGKRYMNEWECGSVDGDAGKSLKVNLGGKAGTWRDFASDTKGGDLIDLFMAVRGCSKADAVREAKEFLNIKDDGVTFVPKRKQYKKPERPQGLTKPNQPMYEFFIDRGLLPETVDAFKIGMTKHQQKGDVIVFPYLRDGELIFTKYRPLTDKGSMWTAKDAEPCLFGWQIMPENQRTLILVEGEIDALAFYQVGYHALSVPRGGGDGAKQDCWINADWERLQLFDNIFLALDNDEQGNKASEHIAQRLGRHRCWRCDFGDSKDANEYQQKGGNFEMLLNEAKSCDPKELKPAKEFIEDVINYFQQEEQGEIGIRLPWAYTHEKFVLKPSEVTVWAGINGHGKSQVLGQVAGYSIAQGARWCIASMEFPAHKLLARMFRQISAVSQPSPQLCRNEILDYIDGNLFLFNVQGRAKAEKILEVFEYAHRRYGCNQFLIDSLAKCGFGEDDYNGQKSFVESCTEFAMKFGVHVHIVCHMRKAKDEYDKPDKMDIKGTGAITDMADNVVNVWRNKKKEAQIAELGNYQHHKRENLYAQPCGGIICCKQRNGEWEGNVNLWFDRASLQYRENLDYIVKPMIKV